MVTGLRFLTVALMVFALAHPGMAQVGGGAGGTGGLGGGFGGGFGGLGGGGNNQNTSAGIRIDADGILSLVTTADGNDDLDKKRRDMLAKKYLSRDLTQSASLRMVSLVQLEKQLEAVLAAGNPIPDEVFYLAGLQRIEHIFVVPEEQDLIIAGPADGFAPDAVGRMIGVASARPVLRLDDLIVALRTVPRAPQIGCSIDPVPARLAELQKFVRQGVPATKQEVEARFNQMDDILGLQDVRIDGVPPDSHFATILVEADYRMKRIAIGVEQPAVKGLKSHLAMLGKGGNVMQRWWFVPLYDAIYQSEDGLSYQFTGQRAQLLAEDEVTDEFGNRSTATTTHKSTHGFAKQFTQKFAQLADKSPVFGELQNLIDWVVLASLIRKEQLAERVGWKQSLFLDAERLTYPTFNPPKQVPSLVNFKESGNLVIGLVGGGVTISTHRPPDLVKATDRTASQLEFTRKSAVVTPPGTAHTWWWDIPAVDKGSSKKATSR